MSIVPDAPSALLLPLLQPPHSPPMAIAVDEHKEKKARIRHSEAQLAALNDLYDQSEHPPLEQRAALAYRIGLESKAVNAWFANKRSASKKKIKGPSQSLTSSSPHNDDDVDTPDDPFDRDHSRMSTPLGSVDYFPALDSDNRHVFDSEMSNGTGSPRRMRIRPTPKQTEELRRLYSANTHPSRADREALGDRIGMKYQSVTNWFQNQRSLARKRAEEEAQEALELESQSEQQHYAYSLPDADQGEASPHHRSSLPPASVHPSLRPAMLRSRSPVSRSYSDSVVSLQEHKVPPAMRRLTTDTPAMRPRRTRPEAYQLEALKKLFARTPNPSIEERGALALEIDMDIGKVTNWFRNLRQTARKKAQKNPDGDMMDDDYAFDSAPVSRAGTPSRPGTPSFAPSTTSSYSSSASGDGDVDHMELDGDYLHRSHHSHRLVREQMRRSNSMHSQSDVESDEMDQEAVTPPPPVSAPRAPGRRRMDVDFLTGSNDDLHSQVRHRAFEKAPNQVAPPKIEDALLLLSFSKHVVPW